MPIDGIAYRLGTSRSGNISPTENIKFHAAHADANGGKVLIRMGKTPSAEKRDELRNGKTILLVATNVKIALKGTIVDCGDFRAIASRGLVPSGYKNPSIWADDTDETRPAWFAVENVEIINLAELQKIQSVNELPLLQSLSGSAPWAYLRDQIG